MAKISVLITTYNSDKYIGKALKSLLNQTFKDFEIILIEDGSTDGTLDVIKTFNDPRIKIYEKSNTGIIDSSNYGITKCTSELIARFDSDDICLNNRLQVQYNSFCKSDAVVSSNAYIINEYEKIINKTNFSTDENLILKSLNSLNNCIINSTVLINKNHLINSGSYNINYKHAEDFELWLRISRFGKIKILKNHLIYLRKHSSNISHLNLNGQLTSSIKALVKSKLNNISISENQITQYVNNFLKEDKYFKYYLDSTNYFINNNNTSYYRIPQKIIFKLLYNRNKKILLKNINKLVDDIAKCS